MSNLLPDPIELQKDLGLPSRKSKSLPLALVHSSYLNENPAAASESNEKIEFLGDAVLGLIIAEKLFADLPQSSEGVLTRLRAALVRKETLAQLARKINLGNYLYLGKGEEMGGGREKDLNLAGAFEALVAAVYLDFGLEQARRFVLKQFGEEIEKQALQVAEGDFKSRLQEHIQAEFGITPGYQVLGSFGPDHDKLFTVEVRAGEKYLGKGSGKSKKAAEMAAARDALRNLSLKE
jgi:ribonuclease III